MPAMSPGTGVPTAPSRVRVPKWPPSSVRSVVSGTPGAVRSSNASPCGVATRNASAPAAIGMNSLRPETETSSCGRGRRSSLLPCGQHDPLSCQHRGENRIGQQRRDYGTGHQRLRHQPRAQSLGDGAQLGQAKPRPPRASGTRIPVQPSPAISRHTSRSNPGPVKRSARARARPEDGTIAATLSRIKRRRSARSWSCSALKPAPRGRC